MFWLRNFGGLFALAFACLALHEEAMALDDTAVTEPRHPVAEESIEAKKTYVEKLKMHRAITNARDATQCTSLKALESQSPIKKFRSPVLAKAWSIFCSPLSSGQIVELKECAPSFSSCRFVEKETSKEFWTDLYNVSPEI